MNAFYHNFEALALESMRQQGRAAYYSREFSDVRLLISIQHRIAMYIDGLIESIKGYSMPLNLPPLRPFNKVKFI
jgi:hypothetical protein